MQIQVTERRKVNHPLRNDASVTNHDDRSRIERRELCAKIFVVLDFLRLHHGNSELHRLFFDRGSRQFKTAPAGPVGLRDDQLYVKSALEQAFERGHGESWRSAEYKVHE